MDKKSYEKKLRIISNKLSKYMDKISQIIKDIFDVWFPNYEELCNQAGIKKETIDKIEELDKKIKKKYFLFTLIPLCLFLLFISGISKMFFNGELSLRFIYFMGQEFSIVFIFIGTLFLSQGLLKDYYQIALESATCLTYNPYIMQELISNYYRSRMGFYFIGLSVIIQIISLTLIYFNLIKF